MTGDGAESPATRHVPLPGGRQLVVRPVEPEDADALAALYAALDPDDRYRRFFSGYHPPPEFFERMATVAERGGFGLVAVVTSGDTEELVGEASYTMLPDGDGELAMTVADRWRGWLGPYLLDALLSAAAARGVPNLEAEVLVTNRPMLALARARGCVSLESRDWSLVRVLIATSGPAPSWPRRHDRQRVLVEGPGGTWHRDAARAAGLEVIACPGPANRRQPCPALAGGRCPLAAGADAIVVRHPDAGPEWPELVAAHQQLHPGVPVCLEAPGAMHPSDGTVPVVPPGDETAAVAFVQHLARPRA